MCGIDHTTTTDDNEEHAQVIVDVAVIAADAAVDAPWERCVGETNVGLGLRRVGIAVRKAARTDAPAYVVDARISATRPGNDRGWTACAQLHGANPSLSSGGDDIGHINHEARVAECNRCRITISHFN